MFKPEDIVSSTDARRLAGHERAMSVTPLDLRQARFSTALRGFDRTEVQALLLEAADSYEQALRENERLRQDLARLEASLNQFRELEGNLKNTLTSAQKVADDMRENAVQEAARLVREADGRVEMVMLKARARAEDVEREIEGLTLKRRDAETAIEATISALRHTLEVVRERDRREREERIVPYRPRLDISRPA